ncbi:MAG: type II secretion system F family protein [Candidatus Pacebacteria bacterium]|nr:type II secretion system F family protein [Candidatus Paceibacterota bacterium]
MISFKAITTEEKLNFIKIFQVLLKSGIPLDLAFKSLIEQTRNPTLKKIFKKAFERVKKGTPIYQIFEEDPHFGKVFSSFIKVGEESGNLEEALNYLAEWLERKSTLEREIASATLYPKIITFFALFIGGGIFYFVFPKLLPIFETLNVKLPLQTRVLLVLANFFKNYGFIFLLGMIGFFLLLKFLLKLPKVKIFFDKIILKTPFLGSFVKSYQLAVISQLIYLLFKSGITITRTLDITSEAVSFYPYKESIKTIKEKVLTGEPLSEGIKRYPSLYPEVYVRVLITAEQTGSFESAFSYLGDFFSSDILRKTKKLPVILEPLILLIIGLFVALVVSGVIMPIYQITKGLHP